MKKAFLSLIPVLFCTMVIGQNSANLRINLEKNKVYRLQSISEQTVLQTVNGNQQTIETKTNYTISLKMVDSAPEFIVAEVRLDTIGLKTNTMGKLISMSSSSEGNVQSKETPDILSYFMKMLSRNALYAKIDFTGKVKEIVNSKMLSDKILKDTALITITDQSASALKTQLKHMVDAEELKTIIEMFTYNLPGKMINTGDSWSATYLSNAGGMSLEISTSYKLDGISGNNADITAESNIRTAANAVPMESGGVKITYDDLKGLTKSTISIDIRTGLVINNISKTHIAGNLGISMPGMNMQIPMDITSDSKTFPIQ